MPSVVDFELEARVDGAKKEGHQHSQEIICKLTLLLKKKTKIKSPGKAAFY